MRTNLLVAIKNLINNQISSLSSFSKSSNRMNSRGESLELYVKDIFCGSLNVQSDLGKLLY